MFILILEKIMKEKGILHPHKALTKQGISSKMATGYLENSKTWILHRHLERICLFLRCTPNDLYEWVPDTPKLIDDDHPMHALKPKAKFDPLAIIKKLSRDEVRRRLGGEEEKK